MMEWCKNDREFWILGNGVKYRWILACKSVRHHLANMDDTPYSEILSFYTAYIHNTPLNQRPDVKSKFRQSVKPYKVEDGIVMHGKVQVLTKRNIHGVLKACHGNPVFGGHFGRDAFMERGGGLPVKTAFQCLFIAVVATNNSDSEKYSKRRS